MRKDPIILACGYLLTAPTLLFGSASGTTTSSSGTAATTLLNRLSTAFSAGNVVHQAQLVPKPYQPGIAQTTTTAQHDSLGRMVNVNYSDGKANKVSSG